MSHKEERFHHSEKIEAYDNHSKHFLKFVRVKKIKENHYGKFEFKVIDEICDKSIDGRTVDYGVILTMIDGVSSYTQIFIAQKYKQVSLSLNLNIKIFRQLRPGKTYELYVKMYNESSKLVVIKCQIYSRKGRLMCLATHIKRNIIPKF